MSKKRLIFVLLTVVLSIALYVVNKVPDFPLGCPYEGAIASVQYDREIALDKVVAIWAEFGWPLANQNVPADSPGRVGLVEGSFEAGPWVVVTVHRMGNRTELSAWVNRSNHVLMHFFQAKEATDLLNRFRQPVEKLYGLPPAQVHTRIHWGCVFGPPATGT